MPLTFAEKPHQDDRDAEKNLLSEKCFFAKRMTMRSPQIREEKEAQESEESLGVWFAQFGV
jgi:hypothetical protein